MKIPSNNNFSVKRLLIVIFVVISVLCIIFFAAISRFNTPLFHAVVINILAPFQSVTSAVSGKISAFGDYVGDVFYVYDENRELKAQNDDLKARAARSAELTRVKNETELDVNTGLVGKTFRCLATEIGKEGTILRNGFYRPIVVREDVPLGTFVDARVDEARSTYLLGTSTEGQAQ